MLVEAKKIGNMAFEVKQGEHFITVDASPEFGGESKGPSPKGLLLSGLIGCSGMDVVAILKKMKTDYLDFKITAETNLTADHPKIFTDIVLRFYFTADEEIKVNNLKKAVKLSMEKYCGVAAMLSCQREIVAEIYLNGEKI